MKQLFENENQRILLHDDVLAFEQRFKAKSADVFGDDYINEMKNFQSVISANQTEGKDYYRLIINTLDGGPTMEPRVQEWMHSYFYPFLTEQGISEKAYCLGEEILSKLSVELTAEDDPNSLFKFRFFATLEEGMDWLKSIQTKTAKQ